MLSRDSEDEMWPRFVFELVIWLQEITFARWNQSSGPLCLWQCFGLTCYIFPFTFLDNFLEKNLSLQPYWGMRPFFNRNGSTIIPIWAIIKTVKESWAGRHEYGSLTISHIRNDNQHYIQSDSLMMREQHKCFIILVTLQCIEVPRHLKGSKQQSNKFGNVEWVTESMALGPIRIHINMR